MNNKKITFNNFRDMGGLRCGDGSMIRKGMLYRTPRLTAKTKADREFLQSLGLDVIIDFRTLEEVEEYPDTIPDGCEYILSPIYDKKQFPYNSITKNELKDVIRLKGKDADEMRVNKLRSYSYMPVAKAAFSPLFDSMDKGKVIAFHCTEGKDRTGIAAMLIEFAFGRSQNEVRKEYMRANEYHQKRNKMHKRFFTILGFDKDLIRNIAYTEHTHDELFDTALNAIYSKYESFDEFFAAEHNVTPERIQNWKSFYTE